MGLISKNWSVLLLICFFTVIAYLPALKNRWTKWDDTKYILENPSTEKLSFENIQRIFTYPVQGNYIPVTFLSFALDRSFWGETPRVFISVNIFLHLLNTLLVCFLIQLLIKDSWVATVSALIFGLHPMHVESVAWIAERKDVLYSLFFLLSLISYLRYINLKKTKWLLFSLFLMILSVLSKSIAVVLPFVLIVVDYFLGRRFDKKVVIEKIPFLVISLLCTYVAKNIIESNTSSMSNYDLSFVERVVIASYALIKYAGLLLVPLNLSAYYPYPFLSRETMPASLWIYFFLTLTGIGILFWRGLKHWNRILIFSMLFFIINLTPLLQLYPVGDAVMADRFVYVALVVFFLPIIYAGKSLLDNEKFKHGVNAFVVIVGICFFYLTYQRCSVWKNAKTLWMDTLKKNNNISLAHVNLGSVYFEEARLDSAIYHFTKAIEIDSKNKDAYYNRGVIYFTDKKYEKAILDFQKTVEINAYDTDALMAMGIAYTELNKYDFAVKYFDKYIDIDSLNAETYVKRGVAKYMLKNYNNAKVDYDKALILMPSYIDAYNKRGVLKIELGDTTGACLDWHEAERLGSKDVVGIINEFCKK